MNKRIIVIGGDCYNTLGMIRTLGEENFDFEAIIIKGDFKIASASKYLKSRTFTIVNSIEEGYLKLIKIKKTITADKAFLLVEGDHLTGYLDEHYDYLKEAFIWNNAGEQGKLSHYLDKQSQVELVKECGINVIPSVIVKTGTIPPNLEYPVMTKAVSSVIDNWKSEVFVCNSEEELKAAYHNISSPSVMIQKFIKKSNELCLDGYSVDRGKKQFIATAARYNYLLDSEYSFYGTISNFENEELEKQITEVMTKVGFEGIYSFEFLIDMKGELHFLEINFRNSGWSYASTCAGMPLPILWMESMDNNTVDKSKVKKIKPDFTFIDDFTDFRTRVGKSISLLEWLKLYKNCDCKLTLGKNDPKPLFTFILSRMIKKIKK